MYFYSFSLKKQSFKCFFIYFILNLKQYGTDVFIEEKIYVKNVCLLSISIKMIRNQNKIYDKNINASLLHNFIFCGNILPPTEGKREKT